MMRAITICLPLAESADKVKTARIIEQPYDALMHRTYTTEMIAISTNSAKTIPRVWSDVNLGFASSLLCATMPSAQ